MKEKKSVTVVDVLECISEKEKKVSRETGDRINQREISRRMACSSSTISRLRSSSSSLKELIAGREDGRSYTIGNPISLVENTSVTCTSSALEVTSVHVVPQT